MKMVHELGLERRESVRFLSTVRIENKQSLSLVREDQDNATNGQQAVMLLAMSGRYVAT